MGSGPAQSLIHSPGQVPLASRVGKPYLLLKVTSPDKRLHSSQAKDDADFDRRALHMDVRVETATFSWQPGMPRLKPRHQNLEPDRT